MNFRKTLISILIFISIAIIAYILLQYLFGFLIINIINIKANLSFDLLFRLFKIHTKINNFIYPVIIVVLYLGSIALSVFSGLLIIIGLFLKPKKKLHGNNRFASFAEIKKAGLIQKYNNNKGDILLGKINDKYLSLPGQLSAFVAAAPRTGKGWSIVLPNLVHFQGSIVVIDLKYENYIKTAGFNHKRGYEVYMLNPEGFLPLNLSTEQKFRSHCWNPFTYVSKDPLLRYQDLYDIANILYPINPNDKNKFFTESAQTLFIAICMFIMDLNLLNLGDELTMANVLRLATVPQESENINEYIKSLASKTDLNEDTKLLLNQFIGGNTKTTNDILSTFKIPLRIFVDNRVESMTSNNSFDLRDLRKKKMTIYICVQPTKINTFAHLIRLFFSQIVTEIEKQGLPENNHQLKHQCLLLLDEFYSLGYMPQIQKAISVLPGYNLRCLVIIQNKNQLYEIYGKEGAESFLKYFHTFIMFTPNNQQDAEEYSQILGYFTLPNRSKSFSRSKSNSSTINHSDQKRAVMLPDELKLMRFENCIICSQYNLPIYAKKIIYKHDKKLKSRFDLSLPPIPILTIAQQPKDIKPIIETIINQPKPSLDLTKLDYHKKVLFHLMTSQDDSDEVKSMILDAINKHFIIYNNNLQ